MYRLCQWRFLQGECRDNLYFLGKRAPLQKQKAHCMQTLEAVYDMKLQKEQIWNAADVLEVSVTLQPRAEAGIRLRPKAFDRRSDRVTAIRRWPNAISSNSQDVLPSVSMGAAWNIGPQTFMSKLGKIVTVLKECGMKEYTGIRWLQKFVNYWRGHGCPLMYGIAQDIMRRSETVRVAPQCTTVCNDRDDRWVVTDNGLSGMVKL